MQRYHFAVAINTPIVVRIMDYFLEYLPDVLKKKPPFERASDLSNSSPFFV